MSTDELEEIDNCIASPSGDGFVDHHHGDLTSMIGFLREELRKTEAQHDNLQGQLDKVDERLKWKGTGSGRIEAINKLVAALRMAKVLIDRLQFAEQQEADDLLCTSGVQVKKEIDDALAGGSDA